MEPRNHVFQKKVMIILFFYKERRQLILDSYFPTICNLRRSNPIYNTSANTSETNATRIWHERDEYDTSPTPTTWMPHECYTNDTSAKRVKKLDFDNDRSGNIFSHSYIHYMANRRLQGEKQFYSKNYLLEMLCFHSRMRLRSAPQKLNFVMTKVISKS